MPPRQKRKADGKESATDAADTESARKRTRSQTTPVSVQKSNMTEQAETITLSLDVNNNQASQGNVFCPPLVENMFDIDTILKDPISGGQAAISSEGEMSFGMKIGDEMPPDMIKCSSDDLSAHVPHQLKEKIWSHKYFNIALLLKGTAELNEIFSGGLLHVSPEGKIEARPKQSKEVIPNIERWTDAFLIFASIYSIRYPDKVQEMFKYMSIVRDAASKFPPSCWRSYDEQFRMRQAITVTNWGQINSDLWLRIMPSAAYKNPFSQTNLSSASSNTCRFFNKGACTFYQCNFRHACDLCGSTYHGMVNCNVGKSQGLPFRGFRTRANRGFRRGPTARGRYFQGGTRF